METSCFEVPDCLVCDTRLLDPALPSGLWVCATAEDVQAVGYNACCLKAYASWEDLGACRDFFAHFPYVFVAAAGEAGRTLAAELNRRVSHTVVVPEEGAFRGFPSVAELRGACGFLAVEHLLLRAYELPALGLLDIADVRPPKQTGKRTVSGFRELDRLTGGFAGGELSVWTGKRGEGKSTLLSQLLLEAAAGGAQVCAYSGELPDWQFRQWMYQQAAGPAHVASTVDKLTGRSVYQAPPPVQSLVDDWLRGSFFLYDLRQGGAHDEDSILQIFEYAHRRYCCDVFLVDNIMTARFRQSRDADYYRAQSNFTGRLVEFAKKYGVHVHLVAHPRKTPGRELEADDVGGTGDITNRADNVFSVRRLDGPEAEAAGCGTVLTLLKNRSHGGRGRVGLDFHEASLRFYAPSGGPGRQYPWEKVAQQQFVEIAEGGDPWSGKK